MCLPMKFQLPFTHVYSPSLSVPVKSGLTYPAVLLDPPTRPRPFVEGVLILSGFFFF